LLLREVAENVQKMSSTFVAHAGLSSYDKALPRKSIEVRLWTYQGHGYMQSGKYALFYSS